MRGLEEDNQAMKTELWRLREELTRTAQHRELRSLQRELEELRGSQLRTPAAQEQQKLTSTPYTLHPTPRPGARPAAPEPLGSPSSPGHAPTTELAVSRSSARDPNAPSIPSSPPGHVPIIELQVNRSDARDPHVTRIPSSPRSTAMLQPCPIGQETPPARS
ncbi:UNVERIFIED_CONTAM: hypothetical protein FKN15_017544 [Acipenser sinensis]